MGSRQFAEHITNENSSVSPEESVLKKPAVRLAGSRIFVSIVFFATVLGLQWASGAFEAEFTSHPDEPAHYVTGLMVRDYIAALAPASPMRFAEDYYLHYPKVALGHWPPFFYVVQAAWTLLFSPSKISMLLFMGLLTTALALLVYCLVRSEFSALTGFASGLLLILLPLVQKQSGAVMTDSLVALLVLGALVFFVRYLDTESWRESTLFGALAAMAVLTKETGLVLALTVPFALLLCRRLYLLRRASLWASATIVLALGIPWYLVAHFLLHQSVTQLAQFGYGQANAVSQRFEQFLGLAGTAIFLMIALGFVVRIIVPIVRKEKLSGRWAVAAALVASFIVFRSFVEVSWEPRHLIIIVPALMMFLVAGVVWLAPRLPLRPLATGQKTILLILALGISFAVESFNIPKKQRYGFEEVARDLLSRSEFHDSVFLVSSESDGEGVFIAEVAQHEQRPGHFVLRASKVLAKGDWSGISYRALYRTPDDVMAYLESVPVDVLVMDLSLGRIERRHHRLLGETLTKYARDWKLVASYPKKESGLGSRRILVYRLVGHENRNEKKIRVNVQGLKRVLTN